MLKTVEKVDDKNLVLGLTIEERANLIEFHNDENDRLEAWLNRKTLLKNSDLEELMSKQYNGIDTFQRGIKVITEQDRDVLYEYLKETEWYKTYHSIFDSYEEEHIEEVGYDFTYAIRYFIQYVKKNIFKVLDNHRSYSFTTEAVIALLQGYCDEVTSIMSKTLAIDIQSFKQENEVMGDTPEERFQSYLAKRFSNVENTKSFYIEYPALLRLVTERTIFFIDNMSMFIKNLEKEKTEIQKIFKIKSTQVAKIHLSAGDSHNKGKTVLLVQFSDDKNLVYKPKNLLYAREINTIFSYFNEKYGSSLYTLKRILRDDYTFEEFVDQSSCRTEDEIRTFYKNYGQLIAVAYILKGTDFHYENLIASGVNPVLIDIETFFQQTPPIHMGMNANVLAKLEQMDSVAVTGLVPFEILKDRSENGEKGINISALSGGVQKAPFKVLKSTNLMTDEMRFEYQDHYIKGSKNLPLLNGKEVAYNNYTNEIIDGFKTFLNMCVMDKENLSTVVEHLFNGALVRNVVRPTQRYTDLLQFSYHPTCMVDMTEREKVLQNLWAYPYTNKEIAKIEYEEMLVGDIPQFFNITTEQHLVTNESEKLEGIYEGNVLNKVLQKINNLNDKRVDQQVAYISTAMGTYDRYLHLKESESRKGRNFSNSEIEKVIKEIERELLEEAIIDHTSKTVTWLDIRMTQDWTVEPLNNQLYDGLPGIYLFFAALDYMTEGNDYKTIKQYLKNTMYTIYAERTLSAFLGSGSLIYPLLVDYSLNNDTESLQVAKEIAGSLMENSPEEVNQDWIQGQTGLVAVFKNLYEITEVKSYKQFAQQLLQKLHKAPQGEYMGFGHGDSSLYYALSLMDDKDVKGIKQIIEDEDKYYSRSEKGWLDPRYKEGKIKNAWCHGSLGILLSRLATEQKLEESINSVDEIKGMDYLFENKEDDCLCHGNMGDVELLIQLCHSYNDPSLHEMLESKVNDILSYRDHNGHFKLQGTKGFRAKGLFTGLAGIGYQLMRYLNRDIPNVLLLEAPILEREGRS
ncbi:type 2 lantipeptide synthetase LanM family protein [Priestia filamentosa]|uniref:type 2 lanthipeptide synthetase LanM family protein n=1 Tax=Priestia filamentosa TaxID=1402861 RepID=UPI003F17F10D